MPVFAFSLKLLGTRIAVFVIEKNKQQAKR
jgi:hypothetical protein